MTLSDYFSPPPWAIPLYLFEATCLILTLFLFWVAWPIVKADIRDRLGLPPVGDAKPKAPGIGEP